MRACAALATLLALGGTAGAASTAYLSDGIAAWSGTDQRRKTIDLRLGRDDLVFRLGRTDTAACQAMDRALRAR